MSLNSTTPVRAARTSRRCCHSMPALQTGHWVLYQTVRVELISDLVVLEPQRFRNVCYPQKLADAVTALSALPESTTKRTWPNRKATLSRAFLNRLLGAVDRQARLRFLSAIRLCAVRLHVDRRQAAPDSVCRFQLALRRAHFSIRSAWEKLLAMLSGRQKVFVHRDAISDR